MLKETWQRARLIPTSGIKSEKEAERRATSALLAVLESVREFGHALVKPLGAPAGPITTYIEVPFELGDRTIRPDGLIRTGRAGKTWTALVEVKTGSAALEREQTESYLEIAREQGFDAVLTISNEIAPAPGVHPVEVDKRKTRKVALRHLSWAEVLTIAVQQRVHRGVNDPDQAWILGELIRYLEYEGSGALDFSDMGTSWVTIRAGVASQTLRTGDKGLSDVISRWEQLLRFAALDLGRKLGANVQVALSRKEAADPSLRIVAQTQLLVEAGVLSGSLRVPDAISDIEIVADLRAGRVTASIDLEAPREGRASTRINWLTRQLKDAPETLRIDAFASGSRSSTSELLSAVREDASKLIADPRAEIRRFYVASSAPLGIKRGRGKGSFIDSVLELFDDFYGSVVQQLRAWAPKAPQLPKGKSIPEESGIDVTPSPDVDRPEHSPREVMSSPAPVVLPAPRLNDSPVPTSDGSRLSKG